MPGVNVTTSARSGPVAPLRASSGQAFFIGQTERGPADVAVRLRSFSDYTSVFGSRVNYGFLYDSVKTFFEEGGEQCYIGRTVGNAATVGTVTLSDQAVAPLSTLRFDAANAGAWSSGVSIVIADGSLADTYKVSVVIAGDTVESVNNISTPLAAVGAFSTSNYVRATNLGSVTAAPNNNPVNGAFALSAGADDRAAIVLADYEDALELFTQGLGDGAVAAPGLGSTVHTALETHASANRRVALLSQIGRASCRERVCYAV